MNRKMQMATRILVNGWLCRAARVGLNLDQSELAALSNTAIGTISRFENELSVPHEKTLERIQAAFENAGIVFTEDEVGLGFKRARKY